MYPKPLFPSANELENLISKYFAYIKGSNRSVRRRIKAEDGTVKRQMVTITERESEPPTAAGLAYFLGFNSKQQFEEYEANGEFADLLRRAKLYIIAEYEKKLHQPSPAGAIHMLKTLGWLNQPAEKTPATNESDHVFRVEMVPAELDPVSSEEEVIL